MARERMDISGQKFGKLTAVRFSHKSGVKNYWECLCECGSRGTYAISEIKRKRGIEKRSCGCSLIDAISTHGNSKSPEYKTWKRIKNRCYNKSGTAFIHYGGRGITVCDRWLESFENFYADMGPRPSPKHSIDRIDVNGNYEPGNCRWATSIVQGRNKRLSKRNKYGVRGIRQYKNGKWSAIITCFYKQTCLGKFDTKEEAAAARKAAEQKYWGDNNDKAVDNFS